jgi:hypothetical protein
MLMSEYFVNEMLDWEDRSYENDEPLPDPADDHSLENQVLLDYTQKKEKPMASEDKSVIVGDLGEAPASWNTKYLDERGFECQLTLRDSTGLGVLQRAGVAMDHLLKLGCTPWPNRQKPAVRPARSADEGFDASYCYLHQCEMQRHEKDGKHWYSHKVGDTWCKGVDPNV